MLLPESHSSDYSVALPSLAKLTLCAAAIQAACFSFPALAADNPVVEKTAYSDIILQILPIHPIGSLTEEPMILRKVLLPFLGVMVPPPQLSPSVHLPAKRSKF